MLVALKINKYLNVNLSTMLIYDDKIKINIDKNGDGIYDSRYPRVQFKEILASLSSFRFPGKSLHCFPGYSNVDGL